MTTPWLGPGYRFLRGAEIVSKNASDRRDLVLRPRKLFASGLPRLASLASVKHRLGCSGVSTVATPPAPKTRRHHLPPCPRRNTGCTSDPSSSEPPPPPRRRHDGRALREAPGAGGVPAAVDDADVQPLRLGPRLLLLLHRVLLLRQLPAEEAGPARRHEPLHLLRRRLPLLRQVLRTGAAAGRRAPRGGGEVPP